jgi:hypothetical protein
MEIFPEDMMYTSNVCPWFQWMSEVHQIIKIFYRSIANENCYLKILKNINLSTQFVNDTSQNT